MRVILIVTVLALVAVKFNLRWLEVTVLGFLLASALWGMGQAVWTIFFNRNVYVVCVRQAEAWCWPAYLDARMAGKCEFCQAPIFYERKNQRYRKVCWECRERVP